MNKYYYEVVLHSTEPSAVRATAGTVFDLGGQLLEVDGKFYISGGMKQLSYIAFACERQGYVRAVLRDVLTTFSAHSTSLREQAEDVVASSLGQLARDMIMSTVSSERTWETISDSERTSWNLCAHAVAMAVRDRFEQLHQTDDSRGVGRAWDKLLAETKTAAGGK